VIWLCIYSGTPLARPPTGPHWNGRVSGADVVTLVDLITLAFLKVSCINFPIVRIYLSMTISNCGGDGRKAWKTYIWTFSWSSSTNFFLQLAWFIRLFGASLVSSFLFWFGNPGCALMGPHTYACNVCIISSFVINWQFRRIDHNGSHKPISVLSHQ